MTLNCCGAGSGNAVVSKELLEKSLHCAVVVVCLLATSACTRDDDDLGPIAEYSRLLSPDGQVSTHVYHYNSSTGGLTQVMMDFVHMECGTGSAAWHDYDIGVELRWIDATTLEVVYPDGKPYHHNASGDYLGCYDHAVRVVMVPRSMREASERTPTKPVESDDTPSPDGKVFARTFRYGTADTAITQVVVDFPDTRGCRDSAATFYDDDVDLQLNWVDDRTLAVRYPDGQRFDHPPWGTTVRCVTETVEIRMVPVPSPGDPG